MGKHEQALFIYVHILKDTKMAEEYVDLAMYHPRSLTDGPTERGEAGEVKKAPPASCTGPRLWRHQEAALMTSV